VTLLQVHYLCPECRTAAQAALFLFPFALLTLVVARRPWWIVAVVFVLLTWLAGALAGYLAGSGYPAPRLEANGGLALGVLVPIVALWSQRTPPQSSWGRLWWSVLRWQAAGLAAAALVPVAVGIVVLVFGQLVGVYVAIYGIVEAELAAFALPVTLASLVVWALLARRYPRLEVSIWVRLVGLTASAIIVAGAAALVVFWPFGDAEPRSRVGVFLPAVLMVLLAPRLAVPSLRAPLR